MNRAQDKRTWLAGGGAAAVAIAAAGWFFLVSPVRSDVSSLHGQTDNANAQNLTAQIKINKLAKKKGQQHELQAELRTALSALPVDRELPEYTRQLTSQARAAGVGIDGVVVGGIAPVTSAGAGSATTTTTAASAGGVVGIAITVTSTGPAARQLAFLHAVQVQGPRRALVTSNSLSINNSAGEDGSLDDSCKMTTQLTIFATPMSAAARAELQKLLNAK